MFRNGGWIWFLAVTPIIMPVTIICDEVSVPRNVMDLTYANPPIWKLRYSERLMMSPETLDVLRTRDRTSVIDTTLGNKTAFPWADLPRDTSIIQMTCPHQYENPTLMQQIEQGYIGRFYRLLEYLFIENCPLHDVTSGTFNGLTSLKSVYINSRNIRYLPLDVFKYLNSIIFIKMEFCSLTTLSGDMFCHNPKLTFVNFSHNRIHTITSGELANETCNAGRINSLVLVGNQIENLKNVTFESFDLNGILTFSNCSIHYVSNATFRGLSNVRTLNLSHNYIEHIPDYSFASLNDTLQYINVMSNNLTSINASTLFKGLGLRAIVLHTNRIRMITGSFSNVKNLRRLNLENNQLTKLTKGTFHGLEKLNILTLENNNISTIEQGIFEDYGNLKILRLFKNRISHLPNGMFNSTLLLSELDISDNKITTLGSEIFENCAELKIVNLANNNIRGVTRLALSSDRIEKILMSNNTFSVLPAFSIPASTECYSFPTLREIQFQYNHIKSIDGSCFKDLVKLDVSHNQISNMDGFGRMTKLEKLRLRNNKISIVPKIEMEKLCFTLVLLDLGENLIDNIAKNTFSNCMHLEVLLLDDNMISVFDPITLPNLGELRLSSNPLVCDCQNEGLFDWLTYTNVEVGMVKCASGELLQDVSIGECSIGLSWIRKHAKEIGIPLSVLIVLMFITAGVMFRYRYEIQVIAFYKWNIRLRCCCRKERKSDSNITYDAFVCFAEEDLSYVTNTLIPFLEPKYRLCVYYRDFPLGEDIAEAILGVINQSAVIIILLSQSFLKSRWGTFEFRNAHHAAITNEDKRMIIIVLDDSVLNSNLDLTLRSILYTKAYLKKGDQLFVEKLLHAMPVEPVSSSVKENEPLDKDTLALHRIEFKNPSVGYMYESRDEFEDHYDCIPAKEI